MFYPLSKQFKSKRRRLQLTNLPIYGQLYFKIKMGVAGSIFESHPKNFQNQYNFWRCSNDITMIFSYLYQFQICKNQCGVLRPYLEASLHQSTTSIPLVYHQSTTGLQLVYHQSTTSLPLIYHQSSTSLDTRSQIKLLLVLFF